MKPIQIELDYKFNTHPIIEMVQGTVAPFEIAIFDNYEEEKLSNATITINMLKADETFIVLTNGINKVNNIISFISPKDFTRESGKGKIQVIIKGNNFEVYTWEIDVNIIPSVINDDNVPSENIIPIIEELNAAVKKAQDWIESHGDLTELNSKVNLNTDNIKALERSINTLDSDIDNNSSQINVLNESLAATNNKITGIQNDLNTKGIKTLWTGTANALNDTINLSESMQNFDRFIIHANLFGNKEYFCNINTTEDIIISSTNLENNMESSVIQVFEIILKKVSDTQLKINFIKRVNNSGQIQNTSMSITKIEGIKF